MGEVADEGDELKEEVGDGGDKMRQGAEPPNNKTPVAQDDDEKSLHQSTTVFVFWAYVVAFVTVLTLSLIFISSIMPSDEEAEFLSMPMEVRQHSTKGKLLKIDIGPDQKPIKVYAREEGPLINSECVVLLHGLGASSFTYRHVISSLGSQGFHVIALDFPGAGLSEKPMLNHWGLLAKLREIYQEISDKGLFWRFEQMFETGAFPEPKLSSSGNGLHYDVEDLVESLAQSISLLVPSPVHIVLHDTSVEAGLTWAIRNPLLIRSITLIDSYPGSPSFPAGLLGVPGLGFVALQSSILHQLLLQRCCVTSCTQTEAGFHAFLLRNGEGQRATLQTWEASNATFDIVSSIKGLGHLPLQILWSNSSGKPWQDVGNWLASQLSHASYLNHNGGRWPQEDAALEIADYINRFIASLPPTDPAPLHGQEVPAENLRKRMHACDQGHGDLCNNDHDGHGDNTYSHAHMHSHGLGFMGHGGWVM